MNVAIYPRKSKQVDNSDSMEVQIDMCKRYLSDKYGNDYTCTIYDGDYGITGHSIKKRKDFQRMMNDVKEKKIQLVVIQRFDRIARNTRDFCNIYHDMEQAGCELVSVSQQIDTTTPYGKNFMYMQASMAELEWALCSERRKDANKYAVMQGKWTCSNHSTPFGYKPEKIDGIRRLVKDKETEHIAKEIFEHYMMYRNFSACAKYINEKYGTEKTIQSIKHMIHSTVYKGEYRGNLQFCEPYLTSEQWDSLQVKKPLIRQDKNKQNEILFSGMIKCPLCNRNMRAMNRKHASGNVGRYYCCQYNHNTRTCSFNKVKSEILIEEKLIDYISTIVELETVEIEFSAKQEQKTDQTEKYKKELNRLNTMYQKGRIDDDYYDSEYLRLTDLIIKEKPKSSVSDGKLKEVFRGNWIELYNELDKLHKKLFWREIIQEIKVNSNMEVIDVIFL